MEVIVTKADPRAIEMLKDEPLSTISDMTELLNGFTISYVEFSQGLCKNETIKKDLYEPLFSSHTISKYEKLLEIASETA